MTARYFTFEPFHLDVVDERLWKEEACVPLGHKALAVLAELVSHPNQLVTKNDLLTAVWPGISVSESVLTTAVREIRAAVGDTARTPKFVETVYGRGYRFVAPVVSGSAHLPASQKEGNPGSNRWSARAAIVAYRGIVGRDAEWTRLCEWYDAARQGARRIAFVAGEAGIGKTALVDAFVEHLTATSAARIGRGQCIEQYGAGEAYLPVLEAIGRLGREEGEPVVRVLRDHAPSWLPHLASLAPGSSEPTAAIRPERMLRELAEAIEVLTAVDPLVLVLEDLHWSDTATLQWLAYVTRRRDTARLLVLATYRPVEALVRRGPLQDVLAELRRQPQAVEMVLDYLSGQAVDDYLRGRLDGVGEVIALANVLHRRTAGHPLFLAAIVDELIESRSKALADPQHLDLEAMAHTIPVNVRQFIEHQLERLSDEDQAILEAACTAGDPFSTAAVLASTPLPRDEVEARCAALTRAHRILIADGTSVWPDGTQGARYRFRHALFQEAAYARASPGRLARIHRSIGLRLEQAHAPGAITIAAELAVHFEQGRDPHKAVFYLEHAARNAIARSAYAEALRHVLRALDLLGGLPGGPDRQQREATLSLLRAQVLEAIRGWSADEVADAFTRARELSIALRDEPRLLQATWGLIAVSIVRAQLCQTEVLAGEVLSLAKKRRDALFRMAAHVELGGIGLALGRPAPARRHFRLARTLDDRGQHQASVAAFGMDLGIFGRIWATHLAWQDGYADSAQHSAQQAIEMAAATGHAFTQTVTLAYAAMLSQFRRDTAEVDRLTSAAISCASEHGFPYYLAWAEVLRAWSLAAQDADERAVADLRRSVGALQSMAGLRLPYYRALLADACVRLGRVDEGLRVVAQALDGIHGTGERWWEAELHRIRGQLIGMSENGSPHEAARCFRMAADMARAQGARLLELRAMTSLAHSCRGRRSAKSVRARLAQAYGWFTEGLESADLREARSALDQLA